MAYVQCESCGEGEEEVYCKTCYDDATQDAVQTEIAPYAQTLLDVLREIEFHVDMNGSEAGRLNDARKWVEGHMPMSPKKGDTWESVAAQHAEMGRREMARRSAGRKDW